MKTTVTLAAALLLAATASAEVRSIEALGIKADLPQAATIAKHPMEQALKRPAAMIRGTGYMISVLASKHGSVDTAYTAAKGDIKSYTGAKVTTDEKRADGYLIAFENTGSAGMNYVVWGFKMLDGKGYECQTTGSQPKAAETALAICRSLSK